jgi:hypothetical protein
MRILHDVYTSRAQDGSRSFRPDPMSGCLSKREFTNSCRQAQKRKRVTPWTSRLCSLPLEKLSKSMAHRPSQKTEHRRTRSTYRSLACARPRPTSAQVQWLKANVTTRVASSQIARAVHAKGLSVLIFDPSAKLVTIVGFWPRSSAKSFWVVGAR